MYYDLDALEELSRELGFSPSRTSSDELEVELLEGIILVFHNLRNEEDTLIEFKGTPWHCHAKLVLILGESQHVELDELAILNGLKAGDILILERYSNGKLDDRWPAHKNEKIDVQYIEPDEEMRAKRLPSSGRRSITTEGQR